MREYDFISLGEVLIDFIPTGRAREFSVNFGGAPANVAVAMSRNQFATAFCGMVGNDDFGKLIAATFAEENIDFLCPEFTSEATTTLGFVTLSDSGDRSFTFARKPGADMFMTKEQIPPEQIAKTKMLNAGTLSMVGGPAKETTIYALEEAHRQGKIVTLDLNYRDQLWDFDTEACAKALQNVLPYVDLLKVSEEEVSMIGMPIQEALDFYDIKAIIETLGADGSQCHLRNKLLKQEGIKTQVIDTTGAGDAFWGAFLAEILRTGKSNVQELVETDFVNALKMGAVSGYYCVQQKGAIESLPTYSEIIATKNELF
ncbi:MAG: carbohydrate kinase [Clostridiaceae bacterium]|nr:carbohydrate kinase [Clostridiaceae bacterium]